MFKCEECNNFSPKNTRQYKIVIETRPRQYYNIVIRHKLVKNERHLQFEKKSQTILDKLAKEGWKVVHENFSKGYEIVKEKKVCEKCAKILSK